MRHTFIAMVLIVLAVASPGRAQVAPGRAVFEAAVTDRAAARARTSPCHDVERPEDVRIAPPDRVLMSGRPIRVSRSGGPPRFAAAVFASTEVADANGVPARQLFIVFVERRGEDWRVASRVEVPLGPAQFVYDESPVRIARVEDVDDDGEGELFVVLATSHAVACGTGYCSRRRTVLLDPSGNGSLVVNVPTGLGCQAGVLDSVRGTTLFRDENDDGHRDLIVRLQTCPGERMDDEGEFHAPPCERPVVRVHRWHSATDQYIPPAR